MSEVEVFDKLCQENRRVNAALRSRRLHRPFAEGKGYHRLVPVPKLTPPQVFYDSETCAAVLLYIIKYPYGTFENRLVIYKIKMAPDQQKQRTKCNPPEVLLKLVLVATHSHFETPGILDGKRMATILHAGKKVMEKSQRDAEARYVKIFV